MAAAEQIVPYQQAQSCHNHHEERLGKNQSNKQSHSECKQKQSTYTAHALLSFAFSLLVYAKPLPFYSVFPVYWALSSVFSSFFSSV